jgi:hypothetical protein
MVSPAAQEPDHPAAEMEIEVPYALVALALWS